MLDVIKNDRLSGHSLKEISEKEKGKSVQDLQAESDSNIIVKLLLVRISLFLLYRNEEKHGTKEYKDNLNTDHIENIMKHDGITQQFFNEIQSVYQAIISVEKKHPDFIQKNPAGGPLDYVYLPTEEDRKVITSFFPNLADRKIQIPFSVTYGQEAEGTTEHYVNSIRY